MDNIKWIFFIFLTLVSLSVFAEEETTSISSNPAATNILAGSGVLQKAIEKSLGIKDDHGIRFGGTWLGDINQLFSKPAEDGTPFSANSMLQLSLSIDANKMVGWKGSLFDVELLQFNGDNTNGDAGVVQGYNSLPGDSPLSRTELYQLWYRQALFDSKFIFRIGKIVPNINFNNVIKPVPLAQHNIPAVTGLIYTPIFVDAAMLGVLPGYYNSAYGIELTLAPVNEWYVNVGVFDGSTPGGDQTGLRSGPIFNDAYFYIGETGFSWLLGKNNMPGTFALGLWHQDGLILGEPNLSENAASGLYLFGSQRLWYRHPGVDYSGISGFYQYGVNNSDVLRMQQYVGTGFTVFGMIPRRAADTFGAGIALSWLNQNTFSRRTEFMFQSYYQARIVDEFYLEPVLSYIPTPGASSDLPASFAGTLRAIIFF